MRELLLCPLIVGSSPKSIEVVVTGMGLGAWAQPAQGSRALGKPPRGAPTPGANPCQRLFQWAKALQGFCCGALLAFFFFFPLYLFLFLKRD